VASLNYFHRKAYLQLLEGRRSRRMYRNDAMHLSLDEMQLSFEAMHLSLAMDPSLNARSTALSRALPQSRSHSDRSTRTFCVICACSYTPAQDAPRPTPNTSAA
jgi:hypothetical protein